MFASAINGGKQPLLVEYSQRYAAAGAKPAAYYAELLRVAIADGIPFEDFLLDEQELPFTRDVVLPAFDAVTAEFCLRPLIVRIDPPRAHHHHTLVLVSGRTEGVRPATAAKDMKIETAPMLCWMSDKIEVRHTNRYGMGVFVRRETVCAKGELLFVAGGPILTLQDENNLAEACADKFIEISECFSIGPRTLEELEQMPVHFLNRSCEPNAGWKGQLFLMAMRDMQPGEEITYDYAMVMHSSAGSREYFKMLCHCGATHCRGVITENDWQLPELEARYDGWFQWYLQEKINDLRGR